MLPVLMMACTFGGFFIYISAAPIIVYDHLHMGVRDFGYYFIPVVIGMMSGAWLAGRTAHRVSALASVLVGSIIMLVAAVVNVSIATDGAQTLVGVLAPIILYIFGLAYMMPSLSILILDRLPSNRGLASAMQSFAQTGGNALVAGLVVPLVHTSHRQITLAMLVLNLAGLLLGAIWWFRYRTELGLSPAQADAPGGGAA